MIQVACSCGKKLNVKDEAAGEKVKCPGCGSAVAVPGATTPAVSNPAPPAPRPASVSLLMVVLALLGMAGLAGHGYRAYQILMAGAAQPTGGGALAPTAIGLVLAICTLGAASVVARGKKDAHKLAGLLLFLYMAGSAYAGTQSRDEIQIALFAAAGVSVLGLILALLPSTRGYLSK